MPAATALYNLRYPVKEDPRIAPTDFQHLAEDVEALIVTRGPALGWQLYKTLREARRTAGGAAANYLVSMPYDLSVVDPVYGGIPLVNSRLVMIPQIVPAGEVIDGVAYVIQQSGNFNNTATKENKVAAFTFDGTTFTRIAQSATTPGLWTAGQGYRAAPFTSPIAAVASDRLLWAAALWNNNGTVTTTPQIGGNQLLGSVTNINAKSFGLGDWSLEADVPGVSGLLASSYLATALDPSFTNHYWLAFYRNYA